MGQCRKRQFCLRGCPWSSTRVRVETPSKKKKKKKIKIKNSEKKKVLQKEVDSLLMKGAIEVVRDSHKGFYPNIFLVTKKDEGFRPVINLSGLNYYIKKKTFRMATLKDVSQTLRHGNWASTIDLKDAHLHVPIAKEHRRFLRFCWGGKEYQFRRLPFGLSSAPRKFTRLTLPIVTFCRAKGVRVVVYLDDFLVLGRSRSELRRHTDFVLHTLKEAGFQTNLKKCHLDPRQEFEYLGLLWNTRVLRVFLPEDKRAGFKQLGRNLLENHSLVLAQRFLGKAIFAWRAVSLGRLHLRPFQMSVISALRSGKLLMDRDAESTVRWWTQSPTEGLSLKAHSADLSMTTDASTVRWGATLDHRSASGVWSRKEMGLHINHLELLAVLRAVQSFILTLRNRAVTVHLDNVTAAVYLMKEGGTRSRALNELTKEILLYCKRHKVMIASAYLPGVANLGADALSSGTESREWFLDPAVARRVFRRLGEPEVDLFASNCPAQVERYFTLDRKDKRAARSMP